MIGKYKIGEGAVFSIIVLLVVACGGKSIDEVGSSGDLNARNKDGKGSLSTRTEWIKQAKLLEGEYISETYLANCERTKSIYASQKEDNQSVFGFVLTAKNLLSSSPYLKGFSIHEGGYDIPLKMDSLKRLFVYDTKRNSMVNTGFFEMQLEQNGLLLNFPLLHKKERYRKVFPDVDTELRKLIMEGTYVDSLGNKMRFRRNGEVTNFKAYAY